MLAISSLLVMIATSGCVSIYYGRTQEIAVAVVPEDARLTVYPGGQTVDGATEVELDRTELHNLRFTREGYSPVVVSVDSEFRQLRYAFSLVFGFFVFTLVDLATGSLFALHPDRIEVELEPVDPVGIEVRAPEPTPNGRRPVQRYEPWVLVLPLGSRGL